MTTATPTTEPGKTMIELCLDGDKQYTLRKSFSVEEATIFFVQQ